MIEVQVAAMAMDAEGSPVVVLKPVEASGRTGFILPIWIGQTETIAILIASGMAEGPGRPLPYDLMVGLLEGCDAEVVQVAVTALVERTYHAAITLRTPAGTREVDARPSDSIALALRAGAPIFVAAAVFNEAAIPDADSDQGQTMAEFNEFIEKVDPEDFRN